MPTSSSQPLSRLPMRGHVLCQMRPLSFGKTSTVSGRGMCVLVMAHDNFGAKLQPLSLFQQRIRCTSPAGPCGSSLKPKCLYASTRRSPNTVLSPWATMLMYRLAHGSVITLTHDVEELSPLQTVHDSCCYRVVIKAGVSHHEVCGSNKHDIIREKIEDTCSPIPTFPDHVFDLEPHKCAQLHDTWFFGPILHCLSQQSSGQVLIAENVREKSLQYRVLDGVTNGLRARPVKCTKIGAVAFRS